VRREWASRGSSKEESTRRVSQLVAKLRAQLRGIAMMGGTSDKGEGEGNNEANEAIQQGGRWQRQR
jgi:hypothetical protein